MPNSRHPANPQSSMQVTSLSRCLIWTAAAVLAVSSQAHSCQAQVMQAPGTMPGRRFPVPPRQGVSSPSAAAPQSANPATVPQPTSPAQPSIRIGATATAPSTPAAQPNAAPNLPPSLLDKPAGPVQVTLHDGSLSVDAHNSSLSEILKNLEASSGMAVDGFDKDSRIFGVYGPGSPRDVLSDLLDGAGRAPAAPGYAFAGAASENAAGDAPGAPAPPPAAATTAAGSATAIRDPRRFASPGAAADSRNRTPCPSSMTVVTVMPLSGCGRGARRCLSFEYLL